MTRHPLSRLASRLRARLDRGPDAAMPPLEDPRDPAPSSLLAAGRACPAPEGRGLCGRPKTSGQTTCGREDCAAWWEAQPVADVVRWRVTR